jgi:hypothetical protein
MGYLDQSELAKESTQILLRRLVKIFESLGVVDSAQRQRLALDAITAGVILPTITTITVVNTVAAQTGMAGMDREMYINEARITHNNAIRNQLN